MTFLKDGVYKAISYTSNTKNVVEWECISVCLGFEMSNGKKLANLQDIRLLVDITGDLEEDPDWNVAVDSHETIDFEYLGDKSMHPEYFL